MDKFKLDYRNYRPARWIVMMIHWTSFDERWMKLRIPLDSVINSISAEWWRNNNPRELSALMMYRTQRKPKNWTIMTRDERRIATRREIADDLLSSNFWFLVRLLLRFTFRVTLSISFGLWSVGEWKILDKIIYWILALWSFMKSKLNKVNFS